MKKTLLCLLLIFSATASARLAGPVQGLQPGAERDLAEIRRSGVLRVLVNQSRNASGDIKGELVGIEAQRLRALVQQLNADHKARAVRLQLLPRAKEQLIPALLRGEGDLLAPGERLAGQPGAAISATLPTERLVPLVIVARKGNRRYQRLEDLSGRVLLLPVGSAAPAAVKKLNLQLAKRGRAPLEIEMADPSLAAEDVLEMINSGMHLLTAVELPIAERWARVMPALRIDRHMQLEERGGTHWYVRRGASSLHARVDRFLKSYRSPADRDVAFQRLYRHAYRVQNALGPVERQRLQRVRPVLQKHAGVADIDWTFLAALAYKESTLNPSAKGVGGATGLMQITPITVRQHAPRLNMSASYVNLADPATMQTKPEWDKLSAYYNLDNGTGAIRGIFTAGSQAEARQRLAQVADQLTVHAPKVARLLEDAEADLLAFYAFPAEHWSKLRSTNPLERVNREIGRRSDVVGIFPNDAALLRLAGMLLLEQNDEWLVGRRYLSETSMALVLANATPTHDHEEVHELTAS